VRFIIVLCLFGAAGTARAEEVVVLRTDPWAISIRPGTLKLTATPAGGSSFTLSAAQAPDAVTDLKTDGREASWFLPARRIAVSMRLDGDVLAVRIRAEEPGEFTWPVVPADPAFKAYILPLSEGHYVPVDDKDWVPMLAAREPQEVIGLSLPLWGIDCGSHTLTYLVTHPFNCELSFGNDGGRLTSKLTHTFRRNWKRKEYSLLVSLGPPSPVEPAKRYRRWLIEQGKFVPMKDKIAAVPDAAKLPGAAHVYLWGDGVSVKMLQAFKDAGLDRLWLGVDGKQSLLDNPAVVARAKELGYLFGFYDSYHSIHAPGEPDTWETAQFDQALYDTGGIVRADGQRRPGFKKKGYLLSPIAARPYLEKRVTRDVAATGVNSVFVDCDAFGECFDDFSPLHPATQADDMAERVRRMKWISDTFRAVVGSEGGVWYSAPAIHFAQGMTTGIIGWGDEDMKNKSSPYFTGNYWPPGEPSTFFKPAPLKDKYVTFEIDPRYRVPLYEVALHDSVVATDHGGSATLKFGNVVQTRLLLGVLYNTPPLYHMNLAEWERRKAPVKEHYAFFSPLHRETAVLPMSDFEWLTPDRMVQRTKFGNAVEIVANFRDEPFDLGGETIPGRSVGLRRRTAEALTLYSPAPD